MSPRPPAEPAPHATAPRADFDRYEPRFLLWIWEQAGREPDVPVSCAGFASEQHLDAVTLRALVHHLAGHGFLSSYEGYGADDPMVVLRSSGAEQAGRLRTRRDDPAERRRYAQHAVLDWLRARRHHDRPRLSEFFDSRQLFFLGEALSEQEAWEAVSYLSRMDLVACEQEPAGDRCGGLVWLTDLGWEFVWSGASLDDYARRWREQEHERDRSVWEQHFHGVGTVQIAGRDFHHSEVSFPVQLCPADLALLVRRLAPDLNLDPATRRELLRLTDELARHDGGPGGAPGAGPEHRRTGGPGGGRPGGADGGDDDGGEGPPPRLLSRMRNVLVSASEGAAQQLLLNLVTQAAQHLLM